MKTRKILIKIYIKHDFYLKLGEKDMESNLNYTEEQYKEYGDLYYVIANGTIGQQLAANSALKKWIKESSLSEFAIQQMDERMEKEADEEMKKSK